MSGVWYVIPFAHISVACICIVQMDLMCKGLSKVKVVAEADALLPFPQLLLYPGSERVELPCLAVQLACLLCSPCDAARLLGMRDCFLCIGCVILSVRISVTVAVSVPLTLLTCIPKAS